MLDFGAIGAAIDTVQRRGVRGASPRVVYSTTLTSVLEALSQVLEITARTMALQTSCCSGLDAIGYAADLVAKGEVDTLPSAAGSRLRSIVFRSWNCGPRD